MAGSQHYQTRWSDPTLPAGVLRGQPPSVLSNLNETGADAPSDVEAGSLSPSAETADQSGDDAVLYVLDLGMDGMTMAVSTSTFNRAIVLQLSRQTTTSTFAA